MAFCRITTSWFGLRRRWSGSRRRWSCWGATATPATGSHSTLTAAPWSPSTRRNTESSRLVNKDCNVGFLIFGFYCTSKNLLVKESLLVKVRQQVKKDLVKNVVMYNEAGLIKLWASQNNCANEAFLLNPSSCTLCFEDCKVIMMLTFSNRMIHHFECMICPLFVLKIGLLVNYFFTAVHSKLQFTSNLLYFTTN